MRTTLRLPSFALVAAIALCGALFGACGPSGSTPDSGTLRIDAPPYMPDAFGGSNFGQLCTTSDDCGEGGYCVASQNGDICTYGCDQGCPDYYHCRATDVAGKLVSLCLPLRFDFCKPCSNDSACDGGICVQLEGSGYCLPPCPFEGTCPMGYSCGTDPTNQHQGSYCVPNTGSCTCNAMNDGQIRSCENMNAVGTCYGLETCNANAGGWSACNASTASTEVCDGMDNDCDQLIDDGVSGGSCTITNGNGMCPGVALCTAQGLTCQGQAPTAELCNGLDDDCDTFKDELWPTLDQSCSAGIGGCERFGVIRCDSNKTGVECSASAGTPQTELCNGLDDNCDGTADENFKSTFVPPPANPLGATCNVGTGACARTGNFVCASNGSGTTCSVAPGTAGTEGPPNKATCNNVDDDCDGKTDEGYKNQGTGQYDVDTACGSCSVDCTVLYALPNATGQCSTASGTPQCGLVCAQNAYNADGQLSNGCELVIDPQAIYVSTDDAHGADDPTCGFAPYTGPPSTEHPCLTIAQGIAQAIANPTRTRIRVANGIYDEAVTIPNGKQLLGGHHPDNWQRDVAGTGTLITGVGTVTSTLHQYAVQSATITSATVFEGFVVVGPLNTNVAGNSYAIYVPTGSSNLSIINNQIYAGRGGPGQVGGSGLSGATGINGQGRANNPAGYDAKTATGSGTCDPATNDRQYTNGGSLTCGGVDNVSGGNGGGNHCPPVMYTRASGVNGANGLAGDPALGGALGTGNVSGYDGFYTKQGASTYCVIPVQPNGDPQPLAGLDGAAGKNGGHGPSGAGCVAGSNGGHIVNGQWEAFGGSDGTAGGNGGGGGGGGAGGGGDCDTNAGSSPCNHDNLGAHGGGGGSGGCGGAGGAKAGGGGGAIGIFIVGGTAPVVTGNTLVGGEGGRGGNGGAGGNGGVGGSGGDGGLTTIFCSFEAGRGGNGGNGGHGAGGGGGCGGASFGIVTSGLVSPNYCSTANPPNNMSGGAGGTGGTGGYSLVNTGGNGSIGNVGTCQFN